jgi:hypothetical protein
MDMNLPANAEFEKKSDGYESKMCLERRSMC